MVMQTSTPTCATCGCRKFQDGPRGGLSQNIRCENGHCWNLHPTGRMDPIGIDLSGRVPGCTCGTEDGASLAARPILAEPVTPTQDALRRCDGDYDLLERCLELAEARHAASWRGGRWGALRDSLRDCLSLLASERRALMEEKS